MTLWPICIRRDLFFSPFVARPSRRNWCGNLTHTRSLSLRSRRFTDAIAVILHSRACPRTSSRWSLKPLSFGLHRKQDRTLRDSAYNRAYGELKYNTRTCLRPIFRSVEQSHPIFLYSYYFHWIYLTPARCGTGPSLPLLYYSFFYWNYFISVSCWGAGTPMQFLRSKASQDLPNFDFSKDLTG